MDLQLAGKTAVVTAASGGIGGAITRTLIAEGATVLGADLTVTAELKESGAVTVQADLTSEEGVEQLRRAVEAEFDGVDLLVNVVGGLAGLKLGNFADIDDATWQKAFQLNLFANLNVTRALRPQLRAAIVNVSTAVARFPSTGPYWYAASKAALAAWSKSLANELGPQGIRVNAVSPGLIRTALWDEYGPRLSATFGMEAKDFVPNLPALAQVPLNRWAEPEEVANLVAFLGSPVAGFITGADYIIDGGAEKVM